MGAETLDGHVALVTGAARGMGRAIARTLAAAGAAIAVNDLHPDGIAEVVEELTGLGGTAVGVAADVTSSPAVRRIVDDVSGSLGPIDILVNNAGLLRPTRFLDIPEDEWAAVVSTNLTGTFLCAQAVLPGMQRLGWGRIVNLSSTAGKNVSTVGGAHYTAAKAGVLGLTRHLANEVAGDGITVNAVCPGLIDTDMVRSTISPAAVARYAAGFPIPRLGLPEEVAELVTFLASNRAAYITGASLDINGGDLMI
jgi:NAD(P)-dependent dehydrogenase (short-subunit alcohol dehydrogenase family)